MTTTTMTIVVILFVYLSTCTFAGRPPTKLLVAETYVTDTNELDVRLVPAAVKLSNRTLAVGSFEDGLYRDGWGQLTVETSANVNDTLQYYSAGMVEGFLTAEYIASQVENLMAVTFGENATKPPEEVAAFMNAQDRWMREQIRLPSSAFWRQAAGILSQFDGLRDGYARAAATRDDLPTLPIFAFQLLNALGDLFQIIPAVSKKRRIPWTTLEPAEAVETLARRGHCSALIKVDGNFSDLMFGHSSWYDYAATNRIFKWYKLNLHDPSTSANVTAFSSYPGFLYSLDDFYMLSSGLGMTQTSNEIIDDALYDLIQPESLLAWHRVRIANVMADGGKTWGEVFSTHASGTYVNQYMVIDMTKFEPGRAPLRPGTLYVVEEIPGLIKSADQTDALSLGYWPSYNVPFYPEIYNRSGYPALAAKGGSYFSYALAPRAQIFRRDQGSVADLDGLKRILRYNDYENDPYSYDGTAPNPMYAICSRGDLKSSGASAGGCYDTKVTSWRNGFFDQRASVINGPTVGDGKLPPFAWSGNFSNHPHRNLPERYDFSWVAVSGAKF